MKQSYPNHGEGVNARVAAFYELLVRLAARDGYCEQSYQYLADVQGKTVGTIRAWCDTLAECGWIAVERPHQAAKRIIPLVPPPSAALRAKRPSHESISKAKQELIERDGARCIYCGATERLQVDHVVPFSYSGENDIDNYVLCCHRCNTRKGAKEPCAWVFSHKPGFIVHLSRPITDDDLGFLHYYSDQLNIIVGDDHYMLGWIYRALLILGYRNQEFGITPATIEEFNEMVGMPDSYPTGQTAMLSCTYDLDIKANDEYPYFVLNVDLDHKGIEAYRQAWNAPWTGEF